MNDTGWLQGLRRYIAVTAIADLIWEVAHLPLYTIWNEGEPREKLFAVLHCTAGDVLIALCACPVAILVLRDILIQRFVARTPWQCWGIGEATDQELIDQEHGLRPLVTDG